MSVCLGRNYTPKYIKCRYIKKVIKMKNYKAQKKIIFHETKKQVYLTNFIICYEEFIFIRIMNLRQ